MGTNGPEVFLRTASINRAGSPSRLLWSPLRRGPTRRPLNQFLSSPVRLRRVRLCAPPISRGSPLIVDIMGTWCHNCLDSAPVLQQLQNRYGELGLQVVGLSFEIRDDAKLAEKNLNLFKRRFGLTYPVLFCGDLSDSNVDRQLKNQLENFFAFPTTLFVDRTGKVKTIHSGFKGPGTGNEFAMKWPHFMNWPLNSFQPLGKVSGAFAAGQRGPGYLFNSRGPAALPFPVRDCSTLYPAFVRTSILWSDCYLRVVVRRFSAQVRGASCADRESL